MGSGTTKEQKTIRVVTIYSKLENLLDQLENALKSFENETFSTIEELNALLIKQQIDSLQNQINDELINIRTELKKIKTKAEYDMKNKRLMILSNRSQDLYMKNAEIIKSKLIAQE